MKGTWRSLVPAVLATSLFVINSTSLALVVIAITAVAIAGLTVVCRWPDWVQWITDWFTEPAACENCRSFGCTAVLLTACAPSDSKLEPHPTFWRSDAAYEEVERVARKRLEAHLLAVAGTESYLPRLFRRPPVAHRIDRTVALDYGYLKQLRPRNCDRSYCSSTYSFQVQSCLCEAVRYLNVSRDDWDDDGVARTRIIRGLPITADDVQRLRDLNPA
jgi:hypothetical protein